MNIKNAPKTEVLEEVRRLVSEGKWSIDPVHAEKRMIERNITLPEIEYVLLNGLHEKNKDCLVEGEIRYAIRGFTRDDDVTRKELRLPVVIEDNIVVVTVIDLTASPDKPKKAR